MHDSHHELHDAQKEIHTPTSAPASWGGSVASAEPAPEEAGEDLHRGAGPKGFDRGRIEAGAGGEADRATHTPTARTRRRPPPTLENSLSYGERAGSGAVWTLLSPCELPHPARPRLPGYQPPALRGRCLRCRRPCR